MLSLGEAKMNNKISAIALIEVLITILVIAIGMLGYAAMQVKTLSVTQESYNRSQSISILEDASSRMRANYQFIGKDQVFNTYVNNNPSGEYYEWCNFDGGSTRPNPSCTGDCVDENLAAYDIEKSCAQLFDSGVAMGRMGVACTDRDTTDADNCSQGSILTMYLAWTPTSREDVDGDAQYQENTACQNIVVGGGPLPSNYSCVIMDIIP
jgi:type IV pilus assembly protein PilV